MDDLCGLGRAALDDGTKTIRVSASEGRTGEQIELAYTSVKVVGNGSFGVVFVSPGSPQQVRGR